MKRRVCTAEVVCNKNGWDFSEAFPFQFRVSKARTAPCEQWMHFKLGDWHLHHCPRLPRHELGFGNGKVLGVVLGVAVDREGRSLNGRMSLEGKGSLAALEDYIEGLAGRFVVLVAAYGATRIYFDATAGLSAVYSKKDRAVASSVHVAINREAEPETGITSRAVLAREGQYLLGETYDRHCRRVYANHYLDLKTFDMHRHWLGAEDDFAAVGEDRNGVAAEIAARLQQVMVTLAASHSTALPLSAGTDSRLLLAAAAPVLDRIERFYMHDIYKVTRFDREGAQLLAREMGVTLEVIDREDPEFESFMTPDEVAELRVKMAFRTGLSFDGIDEVTVRAVSRAPETTLVLRGNGAEMTRANKWTRAMAAQGCTLDDALAALLNMRAEHLPDRVAPDRLESLRARYAAWHDGLPEPARARMPDVAHAELFMPAAPNNVYYAFERNFYINPFNDRRLMFLTAAFNPLARKRNKLVGKLIHNTTPQLNGLPYAAELKQAHRRAA
ncbi:hypothetical protein FIU86_01670 [Roseovarius sp. THAF9]|uniref:hypothetical protein n=1 Tax=Roseovarius sp. THAF9 TaxID=2587847 RepID=UPI0012685A6D|nr:hypothetical protein [Roseovarius sp. THAF9]QFT91536.1 hypothetical protein FIU86_01670 [Roseovarius sp. THAF9]